MMCAGVPGLGPLSEQALAMAHQAGKSNIIQSADGVQGQAATLPEVAVQRLRAPSVPLAVSTPYFSVWSRTDRLTDSWPVHWSGRTSALCGLVMIDGVCYRWCGPSPAGVAAAKQTGVVVEALSTTYTFEAGGVKMQAAFVSPAMANEPAYASWAGCVLYLGATSIDGAEHTVTFYVDVSGEWCTHDSSQVVTWSRVRGAGAHLLSMGTTGQRVLERTGDQTRIDWGRMYLGVRDKFASASAVGSDVECRGTFARLGVLPGADDVDEPRPASDRWPVLAITEQMGRVGGAGVRGEAPSVVESRVVLAYDERRVVEYFERPLRPYWSGSGEGGSDFVATVTEVLRDDSELREAVRTTNQRVRSLAEAAGGAGYAAMCELAYRQVMGAHGLAADADGTMLMFAKENSSNGCIGTVDVIFSSAPFFLCENPALLEAQLLPVLAYSAMSSRWKFPFAPHDLGVYPKANGQAYGGGEKSEEGQMPVEECGTMLILVEALRVADPARGEALARRYWKQLTMWAEYLKAHGLDPADQLCTDDFAGRLAGNANLSIKAVIALGAYARLSAVVEGDTAARTWRALAETYAAEWLKLAGDGDRTVLAFGKPGTWSLKYNLFWDRALGLGLFPPSLAKREVALYLEKSNTFGVPLDSRETYTKLDFIFWVAALAEDQAGWDGLTQPVIMYLNTTPDRVAMSDWYDTVTGASKGMHARSVVGGIWAKQLLLRPGFGVTPPAKRLEK